MKKTIIFLLIALIVNTLSFSAFGADPGDIRQTDKTGLLKAVSVLDSGFDDRSYSAGITRAEFTELVLKLASMPVSATSDSYSPFDDLKPFHEKYREVITAYNNGIVFGDSGSAKFRPDDFITKNEALTLITRAIGIDGNYSDVMGEGVIIRCKGELSQGTSSDVGGNLSRDDMISILYNSLFLEVPTIVSVGGDYAEYSLSEENNVLKTFHNIIGFEGLVTKNPSTSIYDKEKSPENKIEIKDENGSYNTYDCIIDTNEFLGCYVNYYVSLKNDRETVVWIDSPDVFNTVVNVNSENIISMDAEKLKFSYEDENGDTEDITLDRNISVIYNHFYHDGFSEAIFMPENGKIRFVDNNDDKKYDVAFIEYAQIYVAGTVSSIRHSIIDYFDRTKTLEYFQAYENDELYIYAPDGSLMEETAIKTMDVLTVLKSMDSRSVTIYVSNSSVRGTINSINYQNNTATINGTPYKMTNYVMNSEKLKTLLSPSLSGIFYFDIYDSLVAFQEVSTLSSGYAYILNLKSEKGLGAGVKIRMFTQSGDIITGVLNDKVELNGQKINAEQIFSSHTEGFADISDGTDAICQVIYYEANPDDEVTTIRTANTSGSDDERLWYSAEKASRHYMGYNDTPRVFGEQFAITTDTITFFVPVLDGEVDRESKYFDIKPTTYFNDNGWYDIEFYNATKSNMAKIAVVYGAASRPAITERSPALLINSVSETLNEDGEAVKKVNGLVNSSYATYIESEPGAIGDVKVGDVIQYSTDIGGHIANANIIGSLSKYTGLDETKMLSELFTSTTSYRADNRYMLCRVDKADEYGIRVTYDNSYYFTYVLAIKDIRVYEYDSSAKENPFSLCAAGDIRDGDFLFIRAEVGRPYQTIILR